MIKNIITLKKVNNKVIFLSLFSLFIILSSCNKKYEKKDIEKIITLSLNEFPDIIKVSTEFAPRIDRNVSDKIFLQRFLSPQDELNKSITERDIDFMIVNKEHLFKQKKVITDYVNFNSKEKCISTDLYFKDSENFFKNFDSFVRFTRPYISRNHDFAIVGYNSYSKNSSGGGYLLLNKNKSRWVLLKKIQTWHT